MELSGTAKRGLTIGGVALLAAVGLIGWTRGSEPAPAPGLASPASYAADPEPVAPNPAGRTIYAESPFGGEAAPIVAERQPSVTVESTASAPVVQPVVVRRRAAVRRRHYRPRTRVVVRRRPFKHSAAIVGGSAAGGALVGALAGGGKGAAIGALVGGGGGFVYDRLTHKKKVVVRR